MEGGCVTKREQRRGDGEKEKKNQKTKKEKEKKKRLLRAVFFFLEKVKRWGKKT